MPTLSRLFAWALLILETLEEGKPFSRVITDEGESRFFADGSEITLGQPDLIDIQRALNFLEVYNLVGFNDDFEVWRETRNYQIADRGRSLCRLSDEGKRDLSESYERMTQRVAEIRERAAHQEHMEYKDFETYLRLAVRLSPNERG